jgi:phage tail-like protein
MTPNVTTGVTPNVTTDVTTDAATGGTGAASGTAIDAGLLLANLPGLYRDKDLTGDLRRFLSILAGPLGELHASITRLRDDQTVVACRAPFIPLIGALVGTEVDTTLPERAQRDQVLDAISGYRGKGTFDLAQRVAESLTGWRVRLVDFSARVALIPDLAGLRASGQAALVTAPIADPAALSGLGRADDTVPAVLDVRAPHAVTDAVGRAHFDNLGLFVTPARVAADRRPAALGGGEGRFGFDDRPLDPADTQGVRLQLLDGADGSPLTRSKLAGDVSLFAGTPRGFAIRIGGLDITDPAFRPAVRVLAADLTDFAAPRRPGGGPLTLTPTDLAVDPQLGRILLDPAALETAGTAGQGVRVDYLTAPAVRAADLTAGSPRADTPAVRDLTVDGFPAELVDAFDGTPVRAALRLGVPLAAFHGTDRGWRVARNGVEVTAGLTPVVTDLDRLGVVVTLGNLAIDPGRGLLAFPQDFVTAADVVTATFSHPGRAAQARLFDSLAQRLPKVVPAGVAPVVIDTRRRRADLKGTP